MKRNVTTLCYIEKDDAYLMLHRVKKENDINKDKWVGIGGHLEEGETPDECLLREVKEETGLTLHSYKARGFITFKSDEWGIEYIYLYTADEYSGEMIECNEGNLLFVPKNKVNDLPIWEGDKVFFRLLEERDDYFFLELSYKGEALVYQQVDGYLWRLKKCADEKYLDFNSKLLPTVDKNTMLGVRIPDIRKESKTFSKEYASKVFIKQLPHTYHEENILHMCIIGMYKDVDMCLEDLDKFLPYVNNWAVCDFPPPKILENDLDKVYEYVKKWIKDEHPYKVRYAMGLLMRFFLEDNFDTKYFDLVLNVSSDHYYIKMMQAWFFATAFTKHFDETYMYVKKNNFPDCIKKMTTQKVRDSLCISKEQKALVNEIMASNM